MPRDDRRVIVHQLPEYEDSGYPPTYEYLLPARDIASDARSNMGDWISRVADLDSNDAASFLQELWTDSTHNSLCAFRDHLLHFAPRSVVQHGMRWWLLCAQPSSSGGDNDFYLLSPYMNDAEVLTHCQAAGLENSAKIVAEFFTTFGGYREDFPPAGGYFHDFHDGTGWQVINESWMEDIQGYDEWRDSVVLFTSRGGDPLLLHPTGRVGWWFGGEGRIREAYASFCECLVEFAAYQRTAWPFDPYGPPSQ